MVVNPTMVLQVVQNQNLVTGAGFPPHLPLPLVRHLLIVTRYFKIQTGTDNDSDSSLV